MKKITALVLIAFSISFGADTSFQRSITDYFKSDGISLIIIRVLCGNITVQQRDKDVSIQGRIFVDMGDLLLSRRMVAQTNISGTRRGDTLIIETQLPMGKLSKVRFKGSGSIFSKGTSGIYLSKPVEISPKSGKQHEVDMIVGISRGVAVRISTVAGKIFLDSPDNDIKLIGSYVAVDGSMGQGILSVEGEKLLLNLGKIESGIVARSGGFMKLRHSDVIGGKFVLNAKKGDIVLKSPDGTVNNLSVNVKDGKMKFEGIAPDSAHLTTKDALIEMKLTDTNNGKMNMNSSGDGTLKVRLSHCRLKTLDARTRLGKLSIHPKKEMTKPLKDSKSYLYHSEGDGFSITLRSGDGNIQVKIE